MINFFIDRPIFSTVLAIIITLAGGVALSTLPVARFPQITPPTIVVSTAFPGADAATIEQSVAAPIEEQVNGVPHMIYMDSKSANDGSYALTVTFEVGTDQDIAAVDVQNQVAIAQRQLPQQVLQQGVTVAKRQPQILLAVAIGSDDPRYDYLFLSNYATLHVYDALARVHGVGQVVVFGARDYGMRIWLDPAKMAHLAVTTQDVTAVLTEQNVVAPAGTVGAEPAPPGQQMQYVASVKGRLSTTEQYGASSCAPGPTAPSSTSRTSPASNSPPPTIRGPPGSTAYRPPSSASINCRTPTRSTWPRGVRQAMDALAPTFPQGIHYSHSLRHHAVRLRIGARGGQDAAGGGRAGAAGGVHLPRELARDTDTHACGAGVPDRRVQRLRRARLLAQYPDAVRAWCSPSAWSWTTPSSWSKPSPRSWTAASWQRREATKAAMKEVAGPVVAIALVLISVFVPVSFLGGLTGQFYRQFALTLAVSVAISALIALTFTPALCALLLKPTEESHFGGILGRVFQVFDRGFKSFTARYVGSVGTAIRRSVRSMAIFLILTVAALWLLHARPTRLHAGRGPGLSDRPGDPAGGRVAATYRSGGRGIQRDPAQAAGGRVDVRDHRPESPYRHQFVLRRDRLHHPQALEPARRRGAWVARAGGALQQAGERNQAGQRTGAESAADSGHRHRRRLRSSSWKIAAAATSRSSPACSRISWGKPTSARN